MVHGVFQPKTRSDRARSIIIKNGHFGMMEWRDLSTTEQANAIRPPELYCQQCRLQAVRIRSSISVLLESDYENCISDHDFDLFYYNQLNSTNWRLKD